MKSENPSEVARTARAVYGSLLLSGALVALVSCGGSGASEESSAQADVTRGLLTAAAEAAAGSQSGRPSLIREVPFEEVGFHRGSADAPIRVIEMSDYGCGYCRRFHLETFPSLRSEFIESGMVEWKFVPYVAGMFENSQAALRAAECVLEQSPDAFERMNDRLWHEQASWKGSDDPESLVRGWAIDAGADAVTYDACQSGGRRLDRIAAANGLARELGVRGTPTFFVVGYGPLQGALPLDTFRQVLHSVHQDILGRGG